MTRPRTTYYTASTLDGFIADEHDSLDWLLAQPQEEGGGPMAYDDFIAGIGAIVVGATTYQWILDHHTDEGWAYEQPAWVVTHRTFAPAERTTFVAGPPEGYVDAVDAAAGGRGVWIVGGGDLAGQWAEAGLLDEVVLSYAPVTLGAGRPLLPRRLDLELVEVARNGAFVCARHAVRGLR